MAHGYPDYWTQLVSGLAVPSPDQELWFRYGFADIAGGLGTTLITYEVVAGQILYITSGWVSCNFPMTQAYSLSLNDLTFLYLYYDISAPMPFHALALYEVEAGDEIKIILYNLDTDEHGFRAMAIGYLVDIVPGAVVGQGIGLAIPGAGVVP